MAVYRIHFQWNKKEIKLLAKSLDLTHPYFISIKDLILKDTSNVIINPQDDEIKKAFSQTKNLMIPFQSVKLIEELKKAEESKVMPFEMHSKEVKSSS